MIAMIRSSGLRGIYSYAVQVEVDMSQGLPGFDMVGSLSSEVREARERVKVAMKNIGIEVPPSRITVNLSPADIRKDGTAYDLPIAIGILTCLGRILPEQSKDILLIGELGLNGELRPVRGVLPIILQAKADGIKRCIVPADNAQEGAVADGVEVYGFQHIRDVIRFLKEGEQERLPPVSVDLAALLEQNDNTCDDFMDVHGQESIRRAAMISAAGFHHLLMIGPPGSGKTMIAKRIPSILPQMTMEESLEVSSIYSVAGKLSGANGLITKRPFLNPHHTITEQALVGGGMVPKPGVISLAHRGVLFLDELPEFKRSTLDLLRQPIEDRKILITRNNGSYTYPADALFVMAMNPCPCGYYPDDEQCRCTEAEIHRYLSHVSGPILDRIDLMCEVPAVDLQQLKETGKGESSERMRERISVARKIQEKRFAGTGLRFNAEMRVHEIHRFCRLGMEEERFLEQLFVSMHLSARAYHRILRVARTIADLDASERICVKHITEAVCFRNAGEKFWHG